MDSRFDVLVSELCAEIDDLNSRLLTAEKNATYWRDKYNEEINASLKHSETMMGNVLTALLRRSSVES